MKETPNELYDAIIITVLGVVCLFALALAGAIFILS